MSGAGIHCCRICGGSLIIESDRLEGFECERDESCPTCGLSAFRFSYGHSLMRIGVIVTDWNYDESAPADWREQEAEARRIWASIDGMGLVRTMRDHPDDVTPRLILADWCSDNECPLSEAYLRQTSG